VPSGKTIVNQRDSPGILPSVLGGGLRAKTKLNYSPPPTTHDPQLTRPLATGAHDKKVGGRILVLFF